MSYLVGLIYSFTNCLTGCLVLADGGYAKSSITNAADQDIRDDLDEADSLIKSDPRLALAKFESILESRDQSPRALYGKARALDQISVKERSNQYLEQSIQTFLAVLDLGQDVPDDLYRMSGVRVVERMQFRGWSRKAVHVLQEMLNRFPGDVELGNELGVQYLMTGKNIDARKVFSRTVEADPTNGFAAVHLGFILKTGGFEHDQERAASLLKQGIESGEKGTQDGKFYYHLGEVLQRMGKKEESDRVYKEGVEKGFFLSFWQRSLYNVGHLKAQPIWTKQESGERLGLTTLEKNWKVIRSEALSILEEEKFKAEAENLKDTGTWGQFELYRRGEKIPSNCARAPVTCALIDLVPAAKGCKRGQVKFSLMSEGTHVHPHAGPTNCRLRAHLGLVVPEHTGEIR